MSVGPDRPVEIRVEDLHEAFDRRFGEFERSRSPIVRPCFDHMPVMNAGVKADPS